MYNEAAEEFGKCLTHRTALHDPVSRGVADAHVRRAQAHFYASTLKGADKVRFGDRRVWFEQISLVSARAERGKGGGVQLSCW